MRECESKDDRDASSASLIARLHGPLLLLHLRVIDERVCNRIVREIGWQRHLFDEVFNQIGILARHDVRVLREAKAARKSKRVSRQQASHANRACPCRIVRLTCSSCVASSLCRFSSAHVPMIRSNSNQPATSNEQQQRSRSELSECSASGASSPLPVRVSCDPSACFDT